MIPKKLLKEMLDDKFYDKCCRCKRNKEQLHHVYLFSGKQIQEKFSIVPVCVNCHEQATPHNNRYKPNIRYYFEWVAINRMTGDDLLKYNKKNWQQLKIFLNSQKEKYAWKT